MANDEESSMPERDCMYQAVKSFYLTGENQLPARLSENEE